MISGYNEIAKEVGIGLALENLPVFPDLQHMRFYSHNYEDLCELVDSLGDENITVCWDFGHAHLTNFDHAKGLRFVGKRLSCTHVHNNFRDDDRHLHPSLGTMDWKGLMPVLREIGYEGPLTAEVTYTEDTPALESFVAHCYECMAYLEGLV